MVFAVDDDHVLGAANDVNIAVRQISHVAGIQPAIDQTRIGRFLVAEIFFHQRRTSTPHFANGLIGKWLVVLIADFDGHVFHGTSTIDDCAVPDGAVRRARMASQFGLFDQLNLNTFARRHNRYRQRRFGKAIAGQE